MRPVSIRPLVSTAMPPVTIGGRAPKRPTSRPDTGAKTIIVAAMGSM